MSKEKLLTNDDLACKYLIASLENIKPALRERVIDSIFLFDAVDDPVKLKVATKEQAIKVIDNPNCSPYDHLAARLFIHAYKEVQKIFRDLDSNPLEKAEIPTLRGYHSHH